MHILLKTGLGVFLFLVTASLHAQTTATPAVADSVTTGKSSFSIDEYTLLLIIIVVLFLVIGVLALALRSSFEIYKNNRSREKQENNSESTGKGLALTIGLLAFCSLYAYAQTATTGTADAKATAGSGISLLQYVMYFTILLELLAIVALTRWLRIFAGNNTSVALKQGITSLWRGGSFSNWWSNVNKIKPIESEESIDMGHSYDGIRELDNVLPPWFTWTFILSIVFGLGYLWRYNLSASPAPNQYQEYENSVVEAKIKQEAYLKSQGGEVDETTVKMLSDAKDLEEGDKLYQANCTVCHGDKGQGGVGPNLTDDYWLHGGSIGDVFHTIKVGVIDKGMQSWKDMFSPKQIAQISSYIKSMHGTNPPGAKEPQGELFKDETATAAKGSDSTAKAAADTSAKK